MRTVPGTPASTPGTTVARGWAVSAVLLVALLVLTWTAPAARAQGALVGSDPEDGSVLGPGVETVQLIFGDQPQQSGSRATVTTPDGQDVEISGLDVEEEIVRIALPPDGGPGEYFVRWQVVSSDGNPVEGALAFTVLGEVPEGVGEPRGPQILPDPERTREAEATDPAQEPTEAVPEDPTTTVEDPAVAGEGGAQDQTQDEAVPNGAAAGQETTDGGSSAGWLLLLLVAVAVMAGMFLWIRGRGGALAAGYPGRAGGAGRSRRDDSEHDDPEHDGSGHDSSSDDDHRPVTRAERLRTERSRTGRSPVLRSRTVGGSAAEEAPSEASPAADTRAGRRRAEQTGGRRSLGNRLRGGRTGGE